MVALSAHTVVLWVLTPYSLVGYYERLDIQHCLHYLNIVYTVHYGHTVFGSTNI